MKIGRYGPSLSDYEVDIPQEIIASIIASIHSFQNNTRIFALWSCCLLSRSWYSAAISYLYEAPQLSNRNFDKFARTLCPPVGCRKRRNGLESFVRHLDMGNLAYESTKSLTARLLGRTRMSLESFVAPAVSFSVTSLAPLSKCHHLKSLDLSRDHYDIDLTQLLNAIANLPDIVSLSLPRSAMDKRSKPNPIFSGNNLWPKKLAYLRINDIMPQTSTQWKELFISWPSSLTSLAFEDCLNWNPFFLMHESSAVAPNVTSLTIGMRREEDGFPIEVFLVAFPRLQVLAIPTPVNIPDFVTTVSELPGKTDELRVLIFRRAPDVVQPKPRVSTAFLFKCVEIHPNLVRIEIPEAYLEINDESMDDLDRMEELMTIRSKGSARNVGVFLIGD